MTTAIVKEMKPSEVTTGTLFQVGHRIFMCTDNVGPNRAAGQIVWRIQPAMNPQPLEGTIIWPDDEPIEVFV